MPLSFAIRVDQQIEVRQTFESPTVYLDHWAIRRFSDDKNLQNRFVAALHKAGGTLLLSYFNFAEFVGSEDTGHAIDAEVFLDRVVPNVYFAQLDVNMAIAQEQSQQSNADRFLPPQDFELLRLMALQRPTGLRRFTIKGLLTEVVAHRERLGKTFHETNQRIADTVNAKRKDPEYVKQAKTFKAADNRPRIFIVMEEILRGVVLDSTVPFTGSDAADYQHAIIPTLYCDYILLDGKWQDMIQRMERRVAALNLHVTHARCFSDRRRGIETFLTELESYTAPSP